MSEVHARWTDQLSDYLGGDLSGDERLALEAHLEECDACQVVLGELRAIIAGAANLPDLEPVRDVWPEVVAGIEASGLSGGGSGDSDVIELPNRTMSARRNGANGLFVSVPQLAAAAMLLIVFSAAATWFAGPGITVRGGGQMPPSPLPVIMASDDPTPPQALAPELASLEELLEAARATLDPNTVRILERNLAVVEQAIEDSYRALALDPENEFLAEHLERVFERKLEYLRDAARVVEWAG